MDDLELKLLSTTELIDELRTRFDGFALVVETQESDEKSLSQYFYHGGYFRALGLSLAMVDFFRTSRFPTSDEDLSELDDR